MTPRTNARFPFELHAQRTPILCYVTDRRTLPATRDSGTLALLEKIQALSVAGVDLIQIREKDLSGKAVSLFVREAVRRCSQQTLQTDTRTRVIVNDRLDVALTEAADGVHLGEQSIPALDAKRLILARAGQNVAPHFVIGVSCHSLEAALASQAAGAAYIFFGPVFATPSKAAFGHPQGLEQLAGVCARLTIPVLAIGGITLANVAACLGAGASGIAAIRLFQEAEDPASLIRSLRAILSCQ